MIEIITTTLSVITLISVLTNFVFMRNAVYKPSFTPDDCIVELDKRFGFLTKENNSINEEVLMFRYKFQSEKFFCDFTFTPYININKKFILNTTFYFGENNGVSEKYCNVNNTGTKECINSTFNSIERYSSLTQFFYLLDKHAQHLVSSFANIFPNSFNKYCQEKIRKISNNIQAQ